MFLSSSYPIPVTIIGNAFFGIRKGLLRVSQLEVTLSPIAEQDSQLMLLGLMTFADQDVRGQFAQQESDGLGIVEDGVPVTASLELCIAMLLHLLARLGGGVCTGNRNLNLPTLITPILDLPPPVLLKMKNHLQVTKFNLSVRY